MGKGDEGWVVGGWGGGFGSGLVLLLLFVVERSQS